MEKSNLKCNIDEICSFKASKSNVRNTHSSESIKIQYNNNRTIMNTITGSTNNVFNNGYNTRKFKPYVQQPAACETVYSHDNNDASLTAGNAIIIQKETEKH